MKRSIRGIECEIVHQILICELCFDICNSIERIPSRGDDFLPYYYNLNFIKGLNLLHSLLLSQEKSELSIKNYISEHKKNFPRVEIKDFEKNISSISDSFKNSSRSLLRQKIGAHIDEEYRHIDFTRGYIMPHLISKYIKIILELKKNFLEFCNHAKNDCPFQKIKQQSDSILKAFYGREI